MSDFDAHKDCPTPSSCGSHSVCLGDCFASSCSLLPCPFCGGEAKVQRLGTSRASYIVGCTECHCTLESNENGAGYFWNLRENVKVGDRVMIIGGHPMARGLIGVVQRIDTSRQGRCYVTSGGKIYAARVDELILQNVLA